MRLSAFVGEHRGGARTKARLAGVKANIALPGRNAITLGVAQGRRSGPNNDSIVSELKWRHDLSRRTALYAQFIAVRNQSAITTELNDVPNGGGSNDPRGLRIGINHAF